MSEDGSDRPEMPTDQSAIEIDTRPVTIRMTGPGATPVAAYELWERVLVRLSGPTIEAGGMGFSAELDDGR
jgi:hypothetical protein